MRTRPTVPHSVTSPLRGFGLTTAMAWRRPRWTSAGATPASRWSRVDARSSSAFWNHRLALALASSDGIMSRMVRQAGAWGEAGLCCGGRGSQGRRSGAGGGLRGTRSIRPSSKEGACSSNSRGTEEASRGCTRSAQPSKRVSPPRDALEQRGDGSLVPADHALEGAPRRSSAFVGRPMGHALRGGGAEVELGAVGGGVW